MVRCKNNLRSRTPNWFIFSTTEFLWGTLHAITDQLNGTPHYHSSILQSKLISGGKKSITKAVTK